MQHPIRAFYLCVAWLQYVKICLRYLVQHFIKHVFSEKTKMRPGFGPYLNIHTYPYDQRHLNI